MKKKAYASPPSAAVAVTNNSWFDYLFPLLPFLALVPNFFIIPTLSTTGLVTQELVFAVAVLCWGIIGLLQAWRRPQEQVFTKQTLWLFAPLLLLVCWQALSLLWSVNSAETLRQLGFWFGFLVFSLTAWQNLRTRSAWWIFYALAGVAAILALSLAYEYRVYGANEMRGLFFNHGLTAELLATVWPLFACVFLFEKDNRFAVVIAGLMITCTTASLMLTLRRGPLLGVVVASVLILAAVVFRQIRVAHYSRGLIVVLALLFFVVPIVIVKRQAILARLQAATVINEAATAYSTELGLTTRATTWLTALEMGKSNWLKGVGLGAYPSRYAQYRRNFVENPRYQRIALASETEDYDEIRSPLAHNEYLQLFAELGLIGVLLYLAFWSQALYRLWQMRRTQFGFLAFATVVSTISLGVSAAMSAFAFRLTPSILVLVSLLALGWAVRDKSQEQEISPADFKLPQGARLGVLGFVVIASLMMLMHSYNVYASQRTQGSLSLADQLDFTFALGNPAANEASVRRYQRILDYDPGNAGAHLGLSLLLFQMKRVPECLQHADQAYQLGYNRPFTILLRAFAHEHNGAPDKSQEVLREGLASFPKSFILRAGLAELLRKRGQREEAQQQLAELEKRDPVLARSWALALRYKDEEATRLAQEAKLKSPGEMVPALARVLVQARAYHYLRSAMPTPTPTPTPTP